jgi:hypothetical protein
MNPAGAVSIADLLEDAVRRDQALDQFERFLQNKLADRGAKADQEIARLSAELDAAQKRLRDAIDAERGAVDVARVEFEGWRERKRAEERRLADAVAPFVEENPITRERPASGADPRPDPPPTPPVPDSPRPKESRPCSSA